jgi:hypothetical protein
MPRLSSSGKLQINLSLNREAYSLLQKHAATSKGYGQFLGELLRDYEHHAAWRALDERIARLEAVVCLEKE